MTPRAEVKPKETFAFLRITLPALWRRPLGLGEHERARRALGYTFCSTDWGAWAVIVWR